MDLTVKQIHRIEKKREDELLYRDGKIDKRPITWDQLNAEFGYPAKSGEHLRKWYCDRYVRGHAKPKQDTQCSYFEPTGDFFCVEDLIGEIGSSGSSSITVDGPLDPNMSHDDLLLLHGYDPEKWELHSSRSSKLSSGKFSSSICVRPRAASCDVQISEIIKRCLEYVPERKFFSPTHYRAQNNGADYMLEIGMADVHLGKRFFNGGGSSDTREMYLSSIKEFVSMVHEYPLERILFLIGNDFFNFDGMSGTTTKGTPQNNDMTWRSVFEAGVTMAIDAIEMLSAFAPVKVVYVPSNHDKQSGWYMAKVLEAYYSNCQYVEVDASPDPRKYEQHGKCMIVFTHGESDMKRTIQSIPLEAPSMFASTRYRELHTAHIHHIEDKEGSGITQRSLPTFTLPDEWHVNQCYVGTVPRTSAYLWSKEKGLKMVLYNNF